jgi:hypothetical protein
MKTFSVRRWATGILLVLTMMATTFASAPIAVYALVDRVVFEPNEKAPTQIQIWGTFSLSKTQYSANYAEPVKGYLYYKIDSSRNAEATRAVWADLKNIAGTGEVVGFGGGWEEKQSAGKVRPASQQAKNPDAFPIGNPVVRLGASQADVAAKIKAASRAN